MSEFPRICGITPFEIPDARLASAAARSGALAILDLGHDPAVAHEALRAFAADAPRGLCGVRLPQGVTIASSDLPGRVDVVVIRAGAPIAPWRPRRVFVEIMSEAEALAACAAGADALIARGHEGPGEVGEETTFVLLQRLAAANLPVPIFAQGGIGLHTAAAAIAGGAYGVVLDAQLALLSEAHTPQALRQQIGAMDGSEPVLVGRRRVLPRPAQAATASDPPVGQDAAFAKGFAEKFRTVANLVRGLEQAIDAHLRQAKALEPLAPGARWAKQHNLEFPIAQGPMTRVSDRPEFAAAVADAGALPFLALSLLRGDEARRLLEDTRALVGSKTWGVGMLGFAPPDLREEQLKLLTEIKPPVVLIAGGRPAQAKPLEELGTKVYLHVPSPGLLDLFVKDGARRFVLEGRECGGHVGPRSSFVLWESAIERLAGDAHASEMSVLFAGGIHDARSAAMVAAAAAPLAARGVRIGVLMGTAYLFTEEAVQSGAIQPGFQAEAIACRDTVLLDTAPGHATRCAETEFVRAFRVERDRLEAAGTPPREMWEKLEQLNLGRLRVAAKGLVRQGESLRSVDDAEQRKEGMYMIGQVAALRSGTLRMVDLHRDVTEGGTAHVASIQPPAPRTDGPRAPRIAIVGMAGVFPGAPDLDRYWRNIVTGVNSVTEVPRTRWNADAYYDPKGAGEKTPSKWGGFLPEIPFDPAVFGIPPKSLAAIEPVQLLALEVARRALGDAGYLEREFERERASVIFGAEAGTDLSSAYGFRSQWRQFLGDMPEEIDAALPRLTEDSFPGILANVIAGRIANRLDLGGVNFTVDAACASSLAAVDMACKELATGETDMVLCGGADLHNSIVDYLMFASVHALSPTGQCRTFDASADGIALGEGVAALVLKRLEDAERDGDRIYAVIEGVGGSSDGKSLGLTAPRKEGQKLALERAYKRAGVSPADVELVEAHGTGTVVGDRTEMATLSEIFGGAGARPGQVTIGSVKSNIGHTKCAAGLAGLIKVALSIHHRVLPPTMNVKQPNPYWDAETSPFTFRDRAQPWASPHRKAGVSAFGFGGTNFHVVLAEAANGAAPATGLAEWPCELFLVRGATRAQAQAACRKLAALAQSGKPYRLRDLALGAAQAGQGPVRIAFVAQSLAELAQRATAAAGLGSAPSSKDGLFVDDVDAAVATGQVAFLFPGQGSQRPSMLDELFVAFPQLGALLAAGRKHLAKLMPGAAFSPEAKKAQQAAITDTRVAQPTLGLADLAVARLLTGAGVRGDVLAGHSYGELVALCAAGAFDEAALIALSEARAQAILDAARGAPGTMAAVRAGAAQVAAVLGDESGVVCANHNAPDQTVIAGPEAAVEAAISKLNEAGLQAKRIPVACAFHSPVVAAGAEAFTRRLASEAVAAPNRPVFANTTAAPYPHDEAALKAQLGRQLAEPVRFADQIRAMWDAGARIFVEVGPGQVLSDLARRNLGDRPHLAIACDRGAGESSLSSFLHALARLATAGVAVDPSLLFAGRGAAALDLDNPRDAGPPPTAWMVDGQMAKPLRGDLPEFALKQIVEPIEVAAFTAPASAPVAVAANPRETVVLEYLRNMRELVAGQKDVMLSLLGSLPAEPREAIPVVAMPQAVTVPNAARNSADAHAAHAQAAAAAAAATQAAAAPKRSPIEELVAIVSERTGYPPEMLDPDLDLEGDLGIDSIKRIEILGLLGERLGLSASGGSRAELVEELSGVRSLRGIAKWVEDKTGGGASEATAPSGASPDATTAPLAAAAPATPTSDPDADSVPEPILEPMVGGPLASGQMALPQANEPAVRRFVLRRQPLPPAVPNGFRLEQRRFLITDDGLGVAAHLGTLLAARGARVEIVHERPTQPGALDGVIHLAPLHDAPTEDPRKALFELARAAVDGGATWIVAVTANGGGPAPTLRGGRGGVAAMLKSVAHEWPSLRVRAIDLDPLAPPIELAGLVMGEILADDDPVHVAYDGGLRSTVRAVESDHDDDAPPLELHRGDVVLVTGGARGITARAAVALAERHGCTIELVGRSPLPPPEAPGLGHLFDPATLRKALLERATPSERTPARIEQALARLLSDRQIRATLASLAAAGVPHRYHAVDVRDGAAFAALVADVYARHGRLDAVIHGAGVIEDKLLKHKTRDSFDRVFDTKVVGAEVLAQSLRDGVRYVVFFSSVSGTFGNRGQVDYAAANEALDHLAQHLAHHRRHAKVVSVAWGPWAETGMVSPELEREYAKKGVGLIPPAAGVNRLLDEMARGADARVIFMCADPASMEG
jgi:acyl transferase domain-containing protein/NAD(P)H-dependent flavin oxidoreductase YrpB (nitropropane dioxygenase family)/NADP-dependent 3-hydroxy acid dehydrogenase YdfG